MLALAVLFLVQSDSKPTLIDDLRRCGIDERRALTEYRDDLRSRETGVAGSAPVSDDQLNCLANTAATRGYYVEFADPELNRRFDALYRPRMREAGQAVARQELTKRGLLATAPAFESGQSLAAFAARVEAFCGIAPGGLLTVRGPTALTIDPQALRKMPDNEASDRIECALFTVTAADLEARDMSFGFTGNEAFAASKRR